LPDALGSEAEIEGAYRLMNNRSVTFEALVAAHADGTRQRAEEAADVLVLHDTTDCTFPHLDAKEIGYLQTGKAGFRLHLSLVVDARSWRRSLGVISAETVHRPKRSKAQQAQRKKASGPATAKWEDREFERWWRGMRDAGDLLRGCQRVIHIADREGDSYELMARLLGASQRFVIRVRVGDRRGRVGDVGEEDWWTVKQVAANCEGLLEREVPLSRRMAKTAPDANRRNPPRSARIAGLRFAATRIEIPKPFYLRDVPETLCLNLVSVIEENPPPNESAVEWLLYTTEPVATAKQVANVVDDYRTRWTIEEFNAALKGGCAYEARHFESRQALLNMLALSLPVACEILSLRSRARCNPSAPATDVLTPLQIRILRELGSRKLSVSPTAEEALFALAALGGHLKCNGPPGWRILQRAMVKLLTYEAGWLAAQSSVPARQRKKM